MFLGKIVLHYSLFNCGTGSSGDSFRGRRLWRNLQGGDVTADGQRFLVIVESGEGSQPSLTVTTNWLARVKRWAAGNRKPRGQFPPADATGMSGNRARRKQSPGL
jgi:hypothetical protein